MRQLNPDQLKALEAIKSDENIFLTGSAGTGKTSLINYYKAHYNPKIPVVCSTGVAAVLVGGRTFASFWGIGIMDEPLDVIIARIQQNKKMVKKIQAMKDILIDEISMISGKSLDYCNMIARTIRDNPEPFGGIRIIAVGDFFQLPSVTKGNEKVDWAFNSITWKECNFKMVELKEYMRTKDEYFLKVLNSIRHGLVGPEVTKFLNSRIIQDNTDFVGVRIFPRKKRVQEYNDEKLAELPSLLVCFETKYVGDEKSIERLRRNLPIEDKIYLKVGAYVMVRINERNTEHPRYVNGTTGHIIKLNPIKREVMIKTLKGEYISLEESEFQLKDSEGDVIASAFNVALSLAYSLTIHRTQAASIDSALIDCRGLFASGSCYTALSRMTNSENLRIIGWDRRSIFVDPEVKEFYRNQKNLIKSNA